MASPLNIPEKSESAPLPDVISNLSPTKSPFGSPGRFFQLPSPIITKRTRTFSQSEAVSKNPQQTGKIKYFCRQKGHGFITPDQQGEDIFFHISDIDGEIAPKHGDSVSYRTYLVPPKNEKLQAAHVVITNMAPGTHERWDYPPSPQMMDNELG